MAYIPRSSFIPKETSGVIPTQVRRRRTVHVFGLIATILLAVSVLGSVGVFFYNDFLEKQLTTVKEELGKTSVKGTEDKIEEIKIYDRKLSLARNLLDGHLAPSYLFEELESSTKETIRFTEFDYTYDPGFEAELMLVANTRELASSVLQQMQFSEDGLFLDFFVKDIAINTSEGDAVLGTVPEKIISFGVLGALKKELLMYAGDSISEESAITDVIAPQNIETIEGEVEVGEGVSSGETTTNI